MARGYTQAKSEESREIRRQGQALIDRAQAIEAKEMADKLIAKEAKAQNLEPGRDPMRALNHSASLLTDFPPPAKGEPSYRVENWNREMVDAKRRFAGVKNVLESSATNAEFFKQLGEKITTEVDNSGATRNGILYNGALDGRQRATQFLESVKEGLKEGSFGDAFRQANITFKGSKKDEVRIDLPAGSDINDEIVASIGSLGRAMTSTYSEYYGDGFGHTSMPTVVFRQGGKEVDRIDYM
jgi:hypothetical protein